MPYSLYLRQKVIIFVENGGMITEVSHTFGIGRASIYRQLSRQKLETTKVKSHRIKLDWKGLEKDVKQNPESKLADRAKKIGVNPKAIFYALKRMKITRKKQLRCRERNREERIKYYHKLRNFIKKFGSKSLIFIDTVVLIQIEISIYCYN